MHPRMKLTMPSSPPEIAIEITAGCYCCLDLDSAGSVEVMILSDASRRVEGAFEDWHVPDRANDLELWKRLSRVGTTSVLQEACTLRGWTYIGVQAGKILRK